MSGVTSFTLNAERNNFNSLQPPQKDLPWIRLASFIRGLALTFFHSCIRREIDPQDLHSLTPILEDFDQPASRIASDLEEEKALPSGKKERSEMDFANVSSRELPPQRQLESIVRRWQSPILRLEQAGPSFISQYLKTRCHETQNQYVTEFIVTRNCLAANHRLEDMNSDGAQGLVFIPVVFQGSWLPFSRGHIALITVDLVNREIDYFDSFGISILNRVERVVSENNPSIQEILSQVADRFFLDQEVQVRETHDLHQKDFFSCPFYVADRIDQFVNNNEIQTLPTRQTTTAITQTRRVEIHNQMVDWINRLPDNQKIPMATPPIQPI